MKVIIELMAIGIYVNQIENFSKEQMTIIFRN